MRPDITFKVIFIYNVFRHQSKTSDVEHLACRSKENEMFNSNTYIKMYF